MLGMALGLELGELDGASVLGMELGVPLGELEGSEVLGVELQVIGDQEQCGQNQLKRALTKKAAIPSYLG